MTDFLQSSVYFGLLLTLIAYGIGMFLQKKFPFKLCNPLFIAIIICIISLSVFKIDYKIYYSGAKYMSFLLTPATICLAIPLYEQFSLMKKNVVAILSGIIAGVLTSLCSILAMCAIFKMSHQDYVSLLPKSITAAIGMDISKELGGYVSITVAVIAITGVLGNVLGEFIFKLFHIREPIAKGVSLGTSSHILGTVRALEIGEIEGAISSLSLIVAGILTVVGASVFSKFL